MGKKGEQHEPKQRGRTRKSGKVSLDQRKDILDVALALLQKNGYEKVSMVAIAREAGLSQSALYYWFKSKDDIIRELVEVNSASLRKANEVTDASDNVDVCLYKVLYEDAKNLCDLPFDYILVENVARSHPDEFAVFFEGYDELFNVIEDLIERGRDQGIFPVESSADAAAVALAMNEGVQHRYKANLKTAALGAGLKPALVARSSAQIAHTAASGTLVSLIGKDAFEALMRKLPRNVEGQF